MNDLPSADCFQFLDYDIRPAQGRVRLNYGFDNGLRFSEEIDFGRELPGGGSPRARGFEAAVRGLWLAAGASYYKAFAPRLIRSPSLPLTEAEKTFFEKLYRGGLAEFAYRNGIDIVDRVDFRRAMGESADPETDGGRAARAEDTADSGLPRRSAVLVGGGKDSCVSIEILRSGGEPVVLFAVNPKGPILASIEASGYEHIAIKRSLDPELFRLNDAGALNGHVPITAVISFIAAASAFVHGFDTIVLSNERSANEGNVIENGRVVNHQYSKSLDFENDLRAFLSGPMGLGLSYFSLLRPLSEIHIATLMGRTDRYDGAFSSCNRSFVIRATETPARWCCDCPKCRFTFLAMATSVDKDRLLGIFGANLLDDPGQLRGYEELAGLSGHKPWECVGEIGESSAALRKLHGDPQWADAAVVRTLAPRLEGRADLAAYWRDLTTPAEDHNLSERYREMLDGFL